MQPFSQSVRLIPRTLLALTLVVAGSATAHAGLATGLDAYYHLDGNGLDSSGNGLDLTLVGNPSFGPGLIGQALSLHGDNSQSATRPGDDSVFNFGANDFSIQAWVNFNSFGSSIQTLIEKFNGPNGPGWTSLTSIT